MARVWLDGSHAPRWARAVFSDRSDGDFAVVPADRPHPRDSDRRDSDRPVSSHPDSDLQRRRAALAPGPWTWLHQVHGSRVVHVQEPGQHAGASADAAVTTTPGAVLAVQTADCAPVLMVGTGSTVRAVGVAHAGWRGVVDGVLEATVQALRSLGAHRVEWSLGPCISPAAYEFGDAELALVVDRYGPAVAARTGDGRPALDLRAAVRAALRLSDVDEADPDVAVPCTASSQNHYSWRARREQGRQSAAVWIVPSDQP